MIAEGSTYKIGVLPALIGQFETLARSTDIQEQIHLVKLICNTLHEQIMDLGIVTGKDANDWLLPLLNDYYELSNKLKHWKQ